MSKATTKSKSTTKTTTLIDSTSSTLPSNSQHPQLQQFPQKLESLMKPNEFQDFLFRLFTYTIILLPTLTSILFPISSSISTSEHVGNLIIDLLTVLLLSLVVKYTMEWPYNWLRQLQRTKITLLKEMNKENTDRTILLVRKIYTFEVIALFSCLVSSVFSSILLIWTRQYTIIDQKRKKVVFNNVNIALLQFWSIFRIIITFTDSLQESSLNSNQLYWETPHMNSWYQDLKHYFLPNASNQILLDHLQQHNRQFDQLKLDLISLQNEIEDHNRRIIIKERSNKSSFTPYPLNIPSPSSNSPIHNNNNNNNNNDYNVFNSSPLNRIFSKKPVSVFSSPTTKLSSSSYSNKPSASSPSPLSASNKKPSLNTIIEEDDNTLIDVTENSYTNFDEIITTGIDFNHKPSILEELNTIINVISNQGSIFNIIKHPNNFCHTMMTELAKLSKLHFELGEYQLVKLFFTEVFDKYCLLTCQKIQSQLQDIWHYPLYHIRKMMVYFVFKLPLTIVWHTISWLIYLPIFIFNWVIIKPHLVGLQFAWVILKFLFVPTGPEKITPLEAHLLQHLLSPAMSPPGKPITKENLEKFAMKPFHLSPTLNNPALFENPPINRKRRPIKLSFPTSLLLIDTTAITNTNPNTNPNPIISSSIKGGKRNHRTYSRYQGNDSFTMYDD